MRHWSCIYMVTSLCIDGSTLLKTLPVSLYIHIFEIRTHTPSPLPNQSSFTPFCTINETEISPVSLLWFQKNLHLSENSENQSNVWLLAQILFFSFIKNTFFFFLFPTLYYTLLIFKMWLSENLLYTQSC